jgi:hypothetical protein
MAAASVTAADAVENLRIVERPPGWLCAFALCCRVWAAIPAMEPSVRLPIVKKIIDNNIAMR